MVINVGAACETGTIVIPCMLRYLHNHGSMQFFYEIQLKEKYSVTRGRPLEGWEDKVNT